MLTSTKLLTLTPQKVRYRASYPSVNVIKDDVVAEHKYRLVFTETALKNMESTGDEYSLAIRNYGTSSNPTDYSFGPQSYLWVSCSCPYFLYHLEVALSLNKSSDYWYSNRRMPVIKNPRLRPYLCKHLYATVLFLMAQDKKDYKKKYKFLTT